MAASHEWKYLLILSIIFSLPYFLTYLYPYSTDEYDVNHKIFQLQEDINQYLSQQRILSSIQQNITITLSNINHRLTQSEQSLLSFQNCSIDIHNQSGKQIGKLREEMMTLSQSFEESISNIGKLTNQLPHLEQQIPQLNRQGVKIVEQLISNSIYEEFQKVVNNSCKSIPSPYNNNDNNMSDDQLTAYALRKQSDRFQDIYYKFPPIDIVDIIDNMTSPTYQVSQTRILPSIGISPKLMIGGPEKVLSSDLSLGECWAMEGSRGFLTVELTKPIHVTAVTITHISKLAAVDATSAPLIVEIYGSDDLESPFSSLKSNIRYDIHSTNLSQYFPFPGPTQSMYRYVQFHIKSNYGNPRYTCLYHVEIHGFPDDSR